ncbi:NADPH:quinone oxidoreductase family protein [Actinacidiphila acidipaludis]|uniref:NADPH:quinone oxidoreductase family protein n=1 Tax=Actinacidiphila acidipaludis TaxID=2873382 RepID=A0ABS7QD43_9ACTN|nr:NADPH:quinone oxidoreductase family protein [Streptomyces acidipaludis]MBY8881081.1 NADPH:quinone oxidoreductase family protein [Streptomyces acidipaludis]
MFSGQAWRLERFGPPEESVELRQMTWAEPSPGQVLVRVRAAGAGYPDVMMTAGRFPLLGNPPFGLGEEAAGEVVAAPAGSRFAVGERVTGITAFLEGWGGYAEYAYLREESTMRVPAGMTDEEAAGFPIAFRTAYAGLVERAPVEAGQTLLVLGAAGSSGGAALQLGKALGATVIAVAGSQEKLDLCTRFGADHPINHRTEDLPSRIADLTGGRGADVVFDPVGGDTASAALRGIARNGRIVLIGLASGRPVALDAMDLLLRNYSAVGVLATPVSPEAEAAAWGRLAELAGDRRISVPLGRVYDFAEVPRMIAEQSAPGAGKSVVRLP